MHREAALEPLEQRLLAREAGVEAADREAGADDEAEVFRAFLQELGARAAAWPAQIAAGSVAVKIDGREK